MTKKTAAKAPKKTMAPSVPSSVSAMDLVHPTADSFKDKVTPKKPDENMFFFRCACGGIHYRHAGYVKTFIPFIKAGGTKEVVADSRQVMVCVACRKSYVWAGEQMYDVSDDIDLTAWEKTEVEMQAATGPGGEC